MATKTRKAISAKRRFDIFKRDGFVCQYCGSHPPEVLLELDHVIPVSDGGSNDSDNLVAACYPCNRGKGASRLTDVPVSLQEKAVEIAEREAQLRGYQEILEGKRQRLDDEMWRVASIYMRQFGDDRILKSHLQSIKHFVDNLGVHECMDAMELATARKPTAKAYCFRYFCGICWNKIKGANA